MERELPPRGHLPATGWTVLILRDVLAWPAADVAALLGVGVAALDRELARARASVPADRPGEPERAALSRLIGSSDPAGIALVRALLREHDRVA
jgi:RNA polymerase sigma-70 factor (ECF subfamily)